MMFNDMMTCTNSGDILSGTGKSQMLKNGNFPRPASLISNSAGDQRNFLSIMSQFNSEQTQVTAEAVKIPEDQIADGKLTEEAQPGLASVGKTKEKQAKESPIVKRSTAAISETMSMVMGLLSVSNPTETSLPIDLVSSGSDLKNAAIDDADLADGEQPTGKKIDSVPLSDRADNNISGPIPTIMLNSNHPASGQFETKLKMQEKANSEGMQEVVQELEFYGETHPESVDVKDGKSDGNMNKTVEGVRVPPVMTGWRQSTSVMGSGMEARIVEKSQASTELPQPIVTEEGKWTNQMEHSAAANEVSSVAREQSRSSESIMKMVNGFFETAEKPTGEGVDLPPVMTGWKQATSVMGAGMEARIVEKSQASTESPQPIVTEEGKWTNKAERSAVPNEVSSVAREQSRAPESIMKTVNGSFETAEAPTGEGVEVPPVMTGLRQSTSVMGMDARNMKQNQESSEMQSPSDPVEPSALNHANQNLDQDYAMTNDTVEVKLLNEEENFAPQKAELVLSAETSTSQRVEGQGQSRIISGKQQSALDIASNTKNDDLSKNTDSENAKVQADSTHETQKISKHQHNVEFLPDMATTRSSVLKDAFASNLDSQKVSSDNRVMDTIVPEEVSSSLHDDIEKAQPSKSKPASFSSMKDSSIIDGVAVQSAETSNTADKEYSRSFMTAENPDNAGRSENDDPIQSSNPKFEDIAVNFAKEGDFAKMSKVDAASTIPLRENRVSQTEIVEQIMEKSVADIKSGRSEIRIDLKPENLGHIRLHVMTEQQHVSVKILAENAQVKEMIESQVSYIKNELQNQGINVNNVKVDFLTSGGSDFAYSQNESSAFRQARQESVYNGVKSHAGMTSLQEPDSPSVEQTATRGGSLVNYFA